MIETLPHEIQSEIIKYLKLNCHVCKVKINNIYKLQKIYKVQSKFIFCSKDCYNFI